MKLGASPYRQYVRGLTVVELVTVIGVVGALIAIVFSVYPMAQEASRATKCTQNLRALGQAFFAYLGEHQQQFPQAYKTTGGWPTELVNAAYITEEAFRCPGNRENPTTYHGTWSHYGYNFAHVATQIRLTGNLSNRTPIRFSQLSSPSTTVLLVENLRADRSKSSYLVWDAFTSQASEYGNPEPRHRKAFHILWCDGHVSSLRAPGPQAAYNPEILGSYSNPASKWKAH